eukprot:7000066-Pyramimonas_sp.AAC.1
MLSTIRAVRSDGVDGSVFCLRFLDVSEGFLGFLRVSAVIYLRAPVRAMGAGASRQSVAMTIAM